MPQLLYYPRGSQRISRQLRSVSLAYRVVFSGYANAPAYIDEPSAVVSAVAGQPGALGILLSEQKPEVPSPLRVVALK